MARASESDPAATSIAWDDDIALARSLFTRFPDLDPLTLRFPDLVRWVIETPGFHGDPKPVSALLLENIQRSWYALYNSR